MKLGPSEAVIARGVVTELQRQGWTTYEEVVAGDAERRADIVARRGPVLAVVECKTNLSLKLLDQLTWWLGQAHLVIGAIGFGRLGPTVRAYCKHTGIGIWAGGCEELREVIEPRLWRRADTSRLSRHLQAEHKSGKYAKAGTQGGYFTPFRQTCDLLRIVATENPGIELREALRAMAHHYSNNRSAMSSLPALIRRGVIQGVRLEDSSKTLRIYPSEGPR